MRKVMTILRNCFVLAAIFCSSSFGFNLDLTVRNAKFMTSPVLQNLGKSVPGSPIPQLDSNIPPSFYGYSMNVMQPSNGDINSKIFVGSPRMTDPSNPGLQKAMTKPKVGEKPKFKPTGSVNSCPVKAALFAVSSVHPTCSPAHPPPQVGDGLGASLAAAPDGQMSACSPGREQECTADKYSPGFCYTSKNYGRNWKMDPHSAKAECPEKTVDVMFVLDGSGSVEGHFDKVKDWVKNVTKLLKYQMRIGLIQIGIVQYSHWYSDGRRQKHIITEVELGKYSLYKDFAKAVNKIKIHKYTTYTGRALQKVKSDFTASERFGSSKNAQLMFLMTDGKSNDGELIKPNADALRNLGITTYAVGVGQADKNELRKIAGVRERVYSVDSFDELGSLVSDLQENILNFVLEGGGSSSTADYNFEFAQTGFSSTFDENAEDFIKDYKIALCIYKNIYIR
uniref:collagen alpha-5(VI) chain-like isoform X2 n=1 Tax=Styela clava TaxID=7725 RepID=UPI001939D8E9|nr:collagen alpha-5(VI) chain-like isoform X2 [Styela clava]